MNWSEQKTRIRRMLRDPDGNIWADAFLLALYNDEQRDVGEKAGVYQDVRVVNVPSSFYSSYTYDFEYAFTDYSDGEVYQCLYFYDYYMTVFSHLWEAQQLEDLTPTSSAVGSNYTHPFEAWVDGVVAAEPPPIKLPADFTRARFVSYDREPLEPIDKSAVERRDPSWRTREGDPLYYWRDEEFSDRIYLYPILSSATWDDSETDYEGDPDNSEYGSTTIDVDNNLLVVFDKALDEIESTGASELPSYLHKYLEYGVISRAYYADTDGYIPSLGEYWEMRKKTGVAMIKRFVSLRKSDRYYRLRPHVGEPVRSRRHPRLPSDYPVTYP